MKGKYIMPKYTIGLDFGTLSGRAVLVDVKNGHEIADSAMDYPHAVIDEYLPGSNKTSAEYRASASEGLR